MSVQKPQRQARPKGSTANFTDEDVSLLIGAVETNVILWDASQSGYRSRNQRDESWTKIADEVFESRFSIADLQTKWSNLRVQFRSYHAKSIETKSGQAAKEPVKWKYFQRLQFLQAAEDTQTPVSQSNLNLVDDTLETFQTLDSSQMDIVTPSPPTPLSRKRKQSDASTQAMKKIAFDGLQKALTSIETEDSYQKFSNYLASELQDVEKNQGKAAAKKIQRKLNVCLINCLDDLEMEAQTNIVYVTHDEVPTTTEIPSTAYSQANLNAQETIVITEEPNNEFHLL